MPKTSEKCPKGPKNPSKAPKNAQNVRKKSEGPKIYKFYTTSQIFNFATSWLVKNL